MPLAAKGMALIGGVPVVAGRSWTGPAEDEVVSRYFVKAPIFSNGFESNATDSWLGG